MTLWSQSLAHVYDRHPLMLLAGHRLPLAVALAVYAWLRYTGTDTPTALLMLGGALIAWIALSAAVTWVLTRHRTQFILTDTGITRMQGSIEQTLPFGDSADYTLTRGPLRRALNLPAELRLSGQQGIMRKWTVKWPVADTHMADLRQTLDTVLKGKRT